jgi:hypothetical protein
MLIQFHQFDLQLVIDCNSVIVVVVVYPWSSMVYLND